MNTVCGGLTSILLLLVFILWIIVQICILSWGQNYTLQNSTIFYNVETNPEEVDISQLMKDFAFGFKFNRQPIDMIDNQYVKIDFKYETNDMQDGQPQTKDIGIYDCTQVSHVNQVHHKDAISANFGKLYCSNPLKDD